MSDDKQLTVHFNNGSKLEFAFPVQVKNSTAAIMDGMKRVLEGDKLVIQTEQQLLIIPWSSVKFVEAAGVPGVALPFGSIKGARIAGAEETP